MHQDYQRGTRRINSCKGELQLEHIIIEPYDKKEPRSIEKYAQLLLGKTFQQVLDDDNSGDKENQNNRGDLGQLIERHHFHYECNSDSNPDFPEAGVELKVTPYKVNANGSISAKERLVLTKINYMDIVHEDFSTGHFWKKSRLLLLVFYLYQREISKRFEYEIKYSKLFSPPAEDLVIIRKDYDIIVNKIKSGLAHELSESDTMYLGACTKGAKGTDRTRQPYNEIEAKPRAFAFKQSYMTYVLNTYIVTGKDTYEPIVSAVELTNQSFEEALKNRLKKYVGLYEREITKQLDVEINEKNKSYEATLVCKMLGVKSTRVKEFLKAGILVKILRYRKKKSDNQEFRLEDINFIDLNLEKFDDEITDDETGEAVGWEYSELYSLLKNRKYLFAVFWETDEGNIFKGCQLWGMPDKDIDCVRPVWNEVKHIIQEGIHFSIVPHGKEFRVENNLPGISHNGIFHIRPHASKVYYEFKDGTKFGKGRIGDSDLLPNGERITRQSYWLNRSYIDAQICAELKRNY